MTIGTVLPLFQFIKIPQMKSREVIQVFEHQKLRFDDSGLFRRSHFDAMVKFNELHQNKYFTIIHNGICFNSYVGVIRIGDLTIEILPKADRNRDQEKNKWHSILLDMLKVCKLIEVDSVSETQLKKRSSSIFDAYLEIYLREVDQLIRKGLIKRYRKNQSNQNALRGKILFPQNIKKNQVHKERFYCEHLIYDKNHLLHQILFRGLLILKNLVNESHTDKLDRLLYEFQDIETVNIQMQHFERIVYHRKNSEYQKAIDIAKIIILNYSPSLNSGSENLLALLFDMNVLWEEYIFRILKKHQKKGIEVYFQNSAKFWENKRIRPDIVVKTTKETFVIDTKWKRIETNKPSDDDLKQMFVYNLHWGAYKTMLLYPASDQNSDVSGVFHYNNSGLSCKLGFVDITDEPDRNSHIIANSIFSKLNLACNSISTT